MREFSGWGHKRRSSEVDEGQLEEVESLDERMERVLEQLEERAWKERMERALEALERESPPTAAEIVVRSRLEKTLSEIESEGEEPEHVHIGRIESRTELDNLVEHYKDIQLRWSFEEDYQDAAEYLETSSEQSDEKPRLVKELEDLELRRAYEIVHGGPPDVPIENMRNVNELLEQYSDERNRTGFNERYRRCDIHFRVKDDHSMTRDELSEKHNVSHGLISDSWNDIEPTLIQRLRGFKEERIMKEWVENNPKVDSKTLTELQKADVHELLERTNTVHRIDSQVTREFTEQLGETKIITTEEVIAAIEQMHRSIPDETHRISYAELDPELDSRKFSVLKHHITSYRDEIEKQLTHNLGLEHNRVRVAVVDSRLYTWSPKYRPDELVSAYESQFYYFKDRAEVAHIIDELRGHLKTKGSLYESMQHIDEVLRQLTALDEGNRPTESAAFNRGSRLEGNVMRFYLDVTGGRLSDLEGRVTKVTGINGQAGIESPRFPEGKELEIVKARLAAIIASDCHLRETGRITYNEAHEGRIKRVQEILQALGDIELEGVFRKGVYEIHIQNQIGLIMIREGMTPGNKAINNPGLPKGISGWCDEAKCAYLEEIIPEDGSFDESHGFSWSRNHALYVTDSSETDGFSSRISSVEIELIKENGNETKDLVEQFDLAFGELKRLQNNENSFTSKTARSLVDAIESTHNNLIENEKKIAESLGIEITHAPITVKYYPKSDQVSVKWGASTSTKDDALKWAILCPPNDIIKRNRVDSWLSRMKTT